MEFYANGPPNPPGLSVVEHAGPKGVEIGAGADEEEDDKEEGLEVEEGGLEMLAGVRRVCVRVSVPL